MLKHSIRKRIDLIAMWMVAHSRHNSISIYNHKRRIHRIGPKPQFACHFEQCHDRFYTKMDLRRHFGTEHQVPLPLTCPYKSCSYETISQYYLDDHINAKHTRQHEYKCNEPGCDYSTYSYQAKSRHSFSHRTRIKARIFTRKKSGPRSSWTWLNFSQKIQARVIVLNQPATQPSRLINIFIVKDFIWSTIFDKGPFVSLWRGQVGGEFSCCEGAHFQWKIFTHNSIHLLTFLIGTTSAGGWILRWRGAIFQRFIDTCLLGWLSDHLRKHVHVWHATSYQLPN